MPFVIIAAVIAIIFVARYYHNKKERNKEITWQEVQKQTDTKRNTISRCGLVTMVISGTLR